MGTIWFWLVAIMITIYVLLDGFDLGAGAIHLLAAKTDEERRQVLASIGPVWDGNEVWLLAAGGTLYFAFPALYASAFSGFYLPLMIVLWLLILRGASIEFRNHIQSAVWDPLWDFLFCTSSLLLAVVFRAALGDVVRRVPLDASGYLIQPQVKENFTTWPLGFVFPVLAVAGIAGVIFELRKHDERKAFFASCAYLAGMLTSVVFGVYPMVLPARNPVYSLTVATAKAGEYGLKIGLAWWIIGIILAAGYFTYVYRSFAGKVAVDKDSHGYGD